MLKPRIQPLANSLNLTQSISAIAVSVVIVQTWNWHDDWLAKPLTEQIGEVANGNKDLEESFAF